MTLTQMSKCSIFVLSTYPVCKMFEKWRTDEEVEELECEDEDGRGGAVAERDEGRVRGQD